MHERFAKAWSVAKQHQHLVPKLWLRQHADSGEWLVQHRRDGAELRVTVNNAAVGKNFYRDPDATSPDERQDVEDFLANRIEGPGAAAFRDAAGGHLPSSASDRNALVQLIAFQLVRSATFRHADQQIGGHLWPVFFAMEVVNRYVAATGERDQSELQAVFDEATSRAPEYEPERDRRSELRVLLRTAHRVAKQLALRDLLVVTRPDRALVLGDAPVVLLHPGGLPAGWPGLLPVDADLIAPLSPSTLLIATTHPLVGGPGTLTDVLATSSNEAQARACHDALYRHPDLLMPSTLFLARTASSVAAPHVGFGPGSGASTFPARHDAIDDVQLDALIRQLGGVDEVP